MVGVVGVLWWSANARATCNLSSLIDYLFGFRSPLHLSRSGNGNGFGFVLYFASIGLLSLKLCLFTTNLFSKFYKLNLPLLGC